MKIFSFDVGITSIGWTYRHSDETDPQNDEIISGVRIFKKPEVDKTKKSLAKDRGEKRRSRRSTSRRQARLNTIKHLLFTTLKIENYTNDNMSPWELRVKALKLRLDKKELAKILLHIAKRRGYNDVDEDIDIDNNDEEKKEEKGKIKKSIEKHKELLKDSGYQTIGELMTKTYLNQKRKDKINENENVRNKNNYVRSIGREMLKDEVKKIFEVQRMLGSEIASTKLEKDFEDIAFFQRYLKPFKIGRCEFYNDENRACKGAPSSERFVILTKIINTLEHLSKLTKKEYDKKGIIQKVFAELESKSNMTYTKFRKIIELDDEVKFNNVNYDKNGEKAAFISLKEDTNKLKEILKDSSIETLDKIACILGQYKSPEDRKRELSKIGIKANIQEDIIKLNFSDTINLSLKALYQILPYMENGHRYDEATKEANLKSTRALKSEYILPLCEMAKEDAYFDIDNPVILRCFAEFRKVYNAMVKKYSKPHFVKIELTREVGKSAKQRKEIEDRQKENADNNEQYKNLCKEIGLAINSENILKIRMWKEQDEICIYSGKKIEIDHIKDPFALDKDHIYPISRSMDDSRNNLVLVFKKENQDKGNRTPYEWLKDTDRWDDLKNRINSEAFKKLPKGVKKKILNKNFSDKDAQSFISRNINDTGYAASLILQMLDKYVEFEKFDGENSELLSKDKGGRQHVVVISGSLTSMLRHYWGLGSKDRGNHLHHASDAIILSYINQKSVKAYSEYLKNKENSYKSSKQKSIEAKYGDDYKIKYALRSPVKNIREKVEESLSKIFVSYASQRKVTGEIHGDTIYSKNPTNKQKKLKGFTDKQDAKERADAIEYGLKYGKIREMRDGIVENGSMVRVDIFRNITKNTYHMVPIYTYDFAIGVLPNKAVVANLKDWKEMDENYEFCFSLYNNDLVEIQQNNMDKSVYAYFVSAAISTASLNFKHHSNKELVDEGERAFFKQHIKKTKNETTSENDKTSTNQSKQTYEAKSVGIQKLAIFKKCVVSPLGEISYAKQEPRSMIKSKNHKGKNI